MGFLGVGHAGADLVVAEVGRAIDVALGAGELRGEVVPAHVAVEVPGGRLGRAVIEFAAAEGLQQLDDCRVFTCESAGTILYGFDDDGFLSPWSRQTVRLRSCRFHRAGC